MWVFSRKENGFCLNLWGKEGFGELDEKGLQVVRKENEKLQRFQGHNWSHGKSLIMLSWIKNVVTCKL